MLTIIFSFLPIILLIALMVKRNSMPSHKALPLSAFVVYGVMLIIFKADPALVHANVLKGFLLSWTPILIIAGAVFLFRAMEETGGLALIRKWLNSVTENKVAQLMIVGWAFPFLIEGASGFGTPAAIAAPILVGLGFPPVRVAILTLITNSVPVSFGAIGTPTWFGFSEISLSQPETLEIAFKTALINSVAALIIPVIALSFVIKSGSVLRNYPFILLSVLGTVIPFLIIARFNYEFPSLIGGMTGLIITVILAKKKVGLSRREAELHEKMGDSGLAEVSQTDLGKRPSTRELIKASFPIWGTILVLILTRIPQLGIKGLLTSTDPSLVIPLGSLGNLRLSPSLVVGLDDIFNTGERWTHSILYVPSLIPFLLVSLLAFAWAGKLRSSGGKVFRETVQQMKKPVLALYGALIFVALMMMGGENSAVNLIGKQLAALSGNSWQFFSPMLGALGSFFSGSATISNLTFGGIQDSIALSLGLERTSILALQSAGASMGNMVCINNIVAVASILALGNKEGVILKKTVWAMLAYAGVAALMSLFLL